jgi:hypothetical protein
VGESPEPVDLQFVDEVVGIERLESIRSEHTVSRLVAELIRTGALERVTYGMIRTKNNVKVTEKMNHGNT